MWRYGNRSVSDLRCSWSTPRGRCMMDAPRRWRPRWTRWESCYAIDLMRSRHGNPSATSMSRVRSRCRSCDATMSLYGRLEPTRMAVYPSWTKRSRDWIQWYGCLYKPYFRWVSNATKLSSRRRNWPAWSGWLRGPRSSRLKSITLGSLWS